MTSTFALTQSRLPVTSVSVMIGGVTMPIAAQGTDLRGVAGLTFTAPRRPGVYRWAVRAASASGCQVGADQFVYLTVR